MNEELLKCFNNEGLLIDPRRRSGVHKKPLTIWHGVVGIWICDLNGKLLCTKRSSMSEGNPGKWQTYLGGHVLFNQTFEETAIRELKEEIGLDIQVSDLNLVISDKREDCMHFFKMYSLVLKENDLNKLKFIDNEISDSKWFSFEEYSSNKDSYPDNWCNNISKDQYTILAKVTKNKFINNMIKAVIFDMDGLLIDSEFLWRRAIVKVFNKLDVPLTLERCKETMGLRIDEVVEYWELKYLIKGCTKEKIVADILEEVINFIKFEGKIMEGVDHIITLFSSQGIPMAIASSSSMNIINIVLEKISAKDKIKIIHSAEYELHGKPHPGVYITTAEKLSIDTSQCLVFEDSTNGVLSAKAARMKCVAVPDHLSADDKIFSAADLIITSLNDFTLEHLKRLETLDF